MEIAPALWLKHGCQLNTVTFQSILYVDAVTEAEVCIMYALPPHVLRDFPSKEAKFIHTFSHSALVHLAFPQ